MTTGYRCVFVDWHSTLSVSRFWGHLEGGTPEERRLFRRIEAALYGNLGELLVPWMRGGLTTEEVMRAVAREEGLDDGLVLREFVAGCERRRFIDAAIPDLVLALRASGRRVVIATDNMDSFARWTAPRLGLAAIFDAILNSAELRGMKGDVDGQGRSLFFGEYLARGAIGPGASVLIDDAVDREGRIAGFGIEYRQAAPRVGLVPELRKIVAAL